MNAYELADELENYVWMNPNNNRDYCKEVKNMLRQQADRIAHLEMLVANRNEIIDKLDLKPQTKPCEPLCKPSVCDCLKKASEK